MIPGLVLRKGTSFQPTGALSTTVPEVAQDAGNLGLTIFGIVILAGIAVAIYEGVKTTVKR